MPIDFPYHFDVQGRTATTGAADHVRDLMEQVLFTAPGERVNRPDFGCGLLQMVFSPNSPEVAAATQFLVQGEIARWLGHLVELEGVVVESEGAELQVTVVYTLRQSGETRREEFRSAGGP